MHIFQIKSNQTLPSPGGILIASPLLNDYHLCGQWYCSSHTVKKAAWELS